MRCAALRDRLRPRDTRWRGLDGKGPRRAVTPTHGLDRAPDGGAPLRSFSGALPRVSAQRGWLVVAMGIGRTPVPVAAVPPVAAGAVVAGAVVVDVPVGVPTMPPPM